MVIYDKASRGGVAIDGRETAPRRMTHETYLNLTAEKGMLLYFLLIGVFHLMLTPQKGMRYLSVSFN